MKSLFLILLMLAGCEKINVRKSQCASVTFVIDHYTGNVFTGTDTSIFWPVVCEPELSAFLNYPAIQPICGTTDTMRLIIKLK